MDLVEQYISLCTEPLHKPREEVREISAISFFHS